MALAVQPPVRGLLIIVLALGHASEIADAEPPHTPRGCPFQAWSVAALIQGRALTAG